MMELWQRKSPRWPPDSKIFNPKNSISRADTLPQDNELVPFGLAIKDNDGLCVSCSKSMFNGGKNPRYLIDLLFEEETEPKTCDPDAWHQQLDEFIAAHTENDNDDS
jgi:hypothetical protein